MVDFILEDSLFSKKKWVYWGVLNVLIGLLYLLEAEITAVNPAFLRGFRKVYKSHVYDRSGTPMHMTFVNAWNEADGVRIYEIPTFLKQAILLAEDHRFYDHHGVDWLGRLHASWLNLKFAKRVRGASTITEQVIKMIHPRPRTVLSRVIEGIEATRLERVVSKNEILEFYVNQVPFAANRRGISQAARYYFNRSLSTLGRKEMLLLAVLMRSPSRLDLHSNSGLAQALQRSYWLLRQLVKVKILSDQEANLIWSEKIDIQKSTFSAHSSHFMQFLFTQLQKEKSILPTKIQVTIDQNLQEDLYFLLTNHMKKLKASAVTNAAVLVVDHFSSEILSWLVYGKDDETIAGSSYDGVLTPRQPGSTLKPFLYGLALERGFSAASRILDAPLQTSVRGGIHEFKNYSRTHYGWVSLREALANSLNIPAVKILQAIGHEAFLNRLRELGFSTLQRNSEFYGDGLALGTGEVSLFEMVQSYSCLAQGGIKNPLRWLITSTTDQGNRKRIYSEESATLINHILSDSLARHLEFSSSLLELPFQTAIKTGTSTDYRDAWLIGYNARYLVGIWLGNMNRKEMIGVTGVKGASILFRSIMARLTKFKQLPALPLSSKLVKYDICSEEDKFYLANGNCIAYSEWFNHPFPLVEQKPFFSQQTPKLVSPHPGTRFALDPRIELGKQATEFWVEHLPLEAKLAWLIDGKLVAKGRENKLLWPLQKGRHLLIVQIKTSKKTKWKEMDRAEFEVF